MATHRNGKAKLFGLVVVGIAVTLFFLTSTDGSVLYVARAQMRLAIALFLGGFMFSGVALIFSGRWLCEGSYSGLPLKSFAKGENLHARLGRLLALADLAVHVSLYLAAAVIFLTTIL